MKDIKKGAKVNYLIINVLTPNQKKVYADLIIHGWDSNKAFEQSFYHTCW
jgi:hypothetical protein